MLIKNYSDLSLETPGCHPGSSVFTAKFKVDSDISGLFPYINAVVEDSSYYIDAGSIQFTLNGIRCSISSEQIHITQFDERNHVLEFIQELIDFINDLDQKKDTIEPDHTPFKKIAVIDIFKLLPKTNCKECGYSTCMAFAGALSLEETDINNCPEFDNPDNENNQKLNALFCC